MWFFFRVVLLGSVLQLHQLSQHRFLFALTAHLTPDSKYFDCTALSLYFNCNYINILFCIRKSILSSILFFSGSDPEQRFLYRPKRALLVMLSLMYDEVWPRQVSLPQWQSHYTCTCSRHLLHTMRRPSAHHTLRKFLEHSQQTLGPQAAKPQDTLCTPSAHPLHTLCTPSHTLSNPLHTLNTPSVHPLHTLSATLCTPSLHSLHIISTPCPHQDGWRPPNS